MVAVRYQDLPFPLLGGIERKVADIMVQPPKLLVAEHCFVERTGALRRRRALTSLSNTTVDGTTVGSYGAGSVPAALALYQGNLVTFDDPLNPNALTKAPQLYEYSESASAWTEHFGYAPGHVEADGISAHGNGAAGIRGADMAMAAGYTLYASLEGDSASNEIRVSLQDMNGTFLASRLLIFGENTATATYANLRVIARLNVIYVFFANQTTRDLMVWIIDCSSRATIAASLGALSVTPVAPVTVATDLHNAGLAVYDVDSNINFGVFVIYKTTTANQLKMGFVNAAGVLASTTTKATTADATSVTCASNLLAAALNGFVYTVTAAADVFAVLMSWSGAAWTTVQTSAALAAFTGGFAENVACRWDNSTTLHIWYTGDVTSGPAPVAGMGTGAATDTARHRIYQKTYTTAGVVAAIAPTALRAWMASRPFLADDGQVYYWAIVGKRLSGSRQPTHFLINAATALPVARVHRSVAAIYEGGIGSHLPSVVQLLADPNSSSQGAWACALMYITSAFNGTADNNNGLNVGLRAVRWFPKHFQSHQVAEVGATLCMAGGIMQEYDGYSVVENNFLAFTESDIINLQRAITGAMTASGLYYYRVIPEWSNGAGERSRGTDLGPSVSVTLGAGDGSVVLTFPSLIMTRKTATLVGAGGVKELVWGIYRTGANPASNKAAYHRVGQASNITSGDSVTFADSMADTVAATNEELYLDSGELDHLAPNSNHIMCSGKGRVFLAGDPETSQTVFFSLLRAPEDPLSFNDALTIVLPDRGGAITGLAVMNETLVIFKKTAIYRVRGDGPDNTLASGSFFDPELISDGVGCEGQRSIVVTPLGVMFKSPRGFQLLDPGFQVQYIGAPLEGLTGSDNPSTPGAPISGAVLLPMDQQVRFAGASTWIYDYWHKQWYLFNNQGLGQGPSVEWHGVHTFCASSAVQYEDDGAVYSGGLMRAVLALLKGPTTQEDLHVRRVAITGAIAGASGSLTVNLYAQQRTTIAQTNPLTGIAPGAFFRQFRTVDEARIVSELKVEIIDNSGSSGIPTLNEIIFEVGVRAPGLSARVAP